MNNTNLLEGLNLPRIKLINAYVILAIAALFMVNLSMKEGRFTRDYQIIQKKIAQKKQAIRGTEKKHQQQFKGKIAITPPSAISPKNLKLLRVLARARANLDFQLVLLYQESGNKQLLVGYANSKKNVYMLYASLKKNGYPFKISALMSRRKIITTNLLSLAKLDPLYSVSRRKKNKTKGTGGLTARQRFQLRLKQRAQRHTLKKPNKKNNKNIILNQLNTFLLVRFYLNTLEPNQRYFNKESLNSNSKAKNLLRVMPLYGFVLSNNTTITEEWLKEIQE
jgi:hypothetical protein